MAYKPPFTVRQYMRIAHAKDSHFSDIIDEMRRAETPELVEALEGRMRKLIQQ